MLYHIRPHTLFNLVTSSSYEDRMVKLVLPDQRTPILLESAVLLSLTKLVRPRTFFEFGTFLGIETLNMAANLPTESRLYTLDLDEQSLKTAQQADYDRPLTEVHMKEQDKLAFLASEYEKRITRLYGDSNTFDFSSFHAKMDMIYVDGGHDLRTLTSDTQNAFQMLSRDHSACIAWHDFDNPTCPAVGPYLREYPNEIFHVEETMMAFYVANTGDLAAKLKTK